MRIFLVRHGESESNVDRSVHKVKADHAIGLSEKGKEQARQAGKVISENISAINKRVLIMGMERGRISLRLWVSPYRRTRETADEIQQTVGNLIRDRKEHILLCEQQFGLFDGIPTSELPKVFPQEHAYYDKCEKFGGRFWARMPLGESRFDVATRVHQSFGTFHRDRDRHGINNIVVVCHGVTLRAFVMMWCHLTPEWFEKEPNPPNGAVRLIEDGYDKGYL